MLFNRGAIAIYNLFSGKDIAYWDFIKKAMPQIYEIP
jgi:hypothetical protein